MELEKQPRLPDPFLRFNGERIEKKSDWACRRKELSQLFQQYVYGIIPGKPETFNTFMNGTSIVVEAGNGNKTLSFAAEIALPLTGEVPYPAVLAIEGVSFPVPDGVAVITYRNGELARQSGGAKFFDIYGRDLHTGDYAVASWGISRLIDALELLPESNIDTSRLAVTGCSRNGRAALVAGAMDERISITLPQEAGLGGDACWRIVEEELSKGRRICITSCLQPDPTGLRPDFPGRDFVGLPVDQHELAAMIAPRALLVLLNDIDWLQPLAAYTCMKAAHRVWEALGVPDRMGVSFVGGHNHCAFSERQSDILNAYIQKYLVGSDVDFDTGGFEVNITGVFNELDFSWWVPWDPLELE